MPKTTSIVNCQLWRNGSYSLHTTSADVTAYLEAYCIQHGDAVREPWIGEPYLAEVCNEVADRVKEGLGFSFSAGNPPKELGSSDDADDDDDESEEEGYE